MKRKTIKTIHNEESTYTQKNRETKQQKGWLVITIVRRCHLIISCNGFLITISSPSSLSRIRAYF